MTTTLPPRSNPLDFGSDEQFARGLSACARGMEASGILRIAAEIRAMIAAGKPVCNLTVGDFSPREFPIPRKLLEGTKAALDAGETNYPPGDGMPALREAIRRYVRREHGVDYPLGAVLVTSGSRPVLYAAFRCLVDPGDPVVFGIPSWNNQHYTWLTGGRSVEIPTHRDSGFQPAFEDLAPHLDTAKLLCLCTPSNPTGTVMPEETLRRILERVVEVNRDRERRGVAPLYVIYDQVYGSLVFGDNHHVQPLACVPDCAPWVIALDGVSKAFVGTGLRVGWCVAPPRLAGRMSDLLAHVGAWAPRAEQLGTAAFLDDPDAVRAFRAETDQRVADRLHALHAGFSALRAEGYPVDCIHPQGAIYLSLQLDLVGRRIGGTAIQNNEAIRQLLLERAGWAVVPFQAFGLEEESGWFRVSVGAVSMQDIADAFPRIRAMLQELQ